MAELERAPELDSGLGWLNTDRSLSFGGELAGRVVVLDFWTYCCMNCMHILPDLAYLEEKYRDEPVAFVGVHSAKFPNEASRETIRAAILRYEIAHPVVIDDDMKLWRAYSVRSWPTQVVVSSRRLIVCSVGGEGQRETVDAAIAQALQQGRADGTLADGPLTVRKEAGVPAASGLAFPGKVLADLGTRRLYIADSNHNRIVIAEPPDEAGRCQLVQVVGTGRIGRDDGPADEATFNHPQGLAVGQGKLHVADTENHLIRAVDLTTFETKTVVGTGEMCNDRAGGGMGTQQGLNSPWDMCIEGATLYVAMAGVHQVWRIDMPVGFARAFAGTGRENLVDGPTESAALAQTSGICSMGGKLYVADSEVSAIRGIDMGAEEVFTVVGEGLFSFGDVDGVHPEARLQHPLGIDTWKQALLVADTYNHKIKLVDPKGRSVRTLYGTGKAGASTPGGQVEFFEPGGLSVAGDTLFVADTNNHRIVGINLLTHDWLELSFEGLAAPAQTNASCEPAANAVDAGSVAIASGCDIDVTLDAKLPEGAHLSAEAPWSVRITADGTTLLQETGKSSRLPLSVRIPAECVVVGTVWHVTTGLAYCTDADGGMCVPLRLGWTVAIDGGGTETEVVLSRRARD